MIIAALRADKRLTSMYIMKNRFSLFFLVVLLTLVQYPLWLGKGGWLDVWELKRSIKAQKRYNEKLEIRNAGLEAQLQDLKNGYDALEELARSELGMIGPGEVFYRVIDANTQFMDLDD